MGEEDVTGSLANPDAARPIISQQPLLGSLFKSQNGSTWDPSQWEDLKFNMYRAQFTTDSTANATFYNPILGLGNNGIDKLAPNPVETISNRTVVGLGSTLSAAQAAIVVDGVNISQINNTTAAGVVINTLGSIGVGASVDIINAGIGYTPSSGFGTYTANLTSFSGSGSGAIASVTVNNAGITSVFVTHGGIGYKVGDEVGITTLGSTSLGRNARFSVGILSAINALEIDDVQGVFSTGTASTITYINQSTGAVTALTGITAESVTNDNYYDGLHLKVRSRNHGMYSSSNVVSVNNVKADMRPTTLVGNIDQTSTDNIGLADTANFDLFENVGVGTTNPGYALVGNEIISYTGLDSTNLTGITRDIDSKGSYSHTNGDLISKYELNGMSLRRINRDHVLGDASVTNPRELDFYHLKIDTSANGIDRSANAGFPKLSFKSTKKGGGDNTTSTKNIQFETITPNVQTIIPTGTSLKSSVRTVSGTSVDGTELPFIDEGYQTVTLGVLNNFNTPRIVASRVNETGTLTELPGNRSFSLDLELSSNNSFVSPAIDLDRVNMVLTSNRLNDPISDWTENNTVKVSGEDPNAAIYITKKIELSNPANSIKVLFDAYRSSTSNIRVLYKIFTGDSDIDSVPYNLFPGYSNIDDLGNVINITKNDGTSNVQVTPSIPNQFKEYEWFVDDLPEFTAFAIKVVMTGTNQATPPRIKGLRAIAVR